MNQRKRNRMFWIVFGCVGIAAILIGIGIVKLALYTAAFMSGGG